MGIALGGVALLCCLARGVVLAHIPMLMSAQRNENEAVIKAYVMH